MQQFFGGLALGALLGIGGLYAYQTTRPPAPDCGAEEIAPAYVYFASNGDSSYVTGEVLALLGGKTTAG